MIECQRRLKNMTQAELACALGVERTTVSMWETGRSRPRAKMLLRLAKVLGCTVDELLRDDPKETEGRMNP